MSSGNKNTSSAAGGKTTDQTFHILPHPARTNDPRDLEPPQPGGGLNSNPELGAFRAREPYVPNASLMQGVQQPKSREELRARAAELNKKMQK